VGIKKDSLEFKQHGRTEVVRIELALVSGVQETLREKLGGKKRMKRAAVGTGSQDLSGDWARRKAGGGSKG